MNGWYRDICLIGSRAWNISSLCEVNCRHNKGVGITQNLRDRDTLNAHNHWFILLYHVRGLREYKSIEIALGWGPVHVRLHTTLENPVTTLQDFGGGLGTVAFGHFLLGSHNFTVTALGSRVKWRFVSNQNTTDITIAHLIRLNDAPVNEEVWPPWISMRHVSVHEWFGGNVMGIGDGTVNQGSNISTPI